MSERYRTPDPRNTDAFKGPAGEGWSEDGDAWYHEALLLPEAEDEALALAQTEELKKAEVDASSPNFRCRRWSAWSHSEVSRRGAGIKAR
jgi:hypothetical protein